MKHFAKIFEIEGNDYLFTIDRASDGPGFEVLMIGFFPALQLRVGIFSETGLGIQACQELIEKLDEDEAKVIFSMVKSQSPSFFEDK